MSKVSCWFCSRLRSIVFTICGPEEVSPTRPQPVHTQVDLVQAFAHNMEEATRLMTGVREIASQEDPLGELITRLRAGGAR